MNLDRVEKLRKDRELSQAELAKAAGVTLRTYTKLLDNVKLNRRQKRVPLSLVAGLSDALGVKYTTLLRWEPATAPR